MEYKIEKNQLVIFTEDDLQAPFLGRKKDGVYRMHWHFIKDFAEWFDLKLPPAIIETVKRKVQEVKKQLSILKLEDDFGYAELLDADYSPYQFQSQATRFIEKQKCVLLADDVGLGKTVVTITTIMSLIWKGKAERFILVVPASLRLQWLREIRKFINRDKFPETRIMVLDGDKPSRKRIYTQWTEPAFNTGIMIMSYANVRNDFEFIKDLPVNLVVLDEATKIKNRGTKSSKAVRKIWGKTEYRLALTATPIENGLEDLYSIVEWVDKTRWKTKIYFMSRYCVMKTRKIWQGRGMVLVEELDHYKNIDDAKQKIAGLYVRRTIADVEMELPSVISTNIELEMNSGQKKLYKEVKGEIYGQATTIDVLAQSIYLQEVCNDPRLIEREGKGEKIKEIERLLQEDYKYEKVIIISRFKKFINLMKGELKRLPIEVITGDTNQRQRQLIIDDFSSGSGQKIIAGTEAIEYGLNLQAGGILINVDLPWNPAKLHQRIGRVRRLGSENKIIRLVNLIMQDTIEARVLEVLYEKGELFEKMFTRDEDVKINNLLEMNRENILQMI